MVEADPGSDEPVLKRFERVIISGVRHELVLTEKRIVIRETESGKVRRDAEYSRIVLANLGMNTLREPELSLSFALDGGELAVEEIVLPHQTGGQNVLAAEKCIDIFRDHGVPTRVTAHSAEMGPPTRAGALLTDDRMSGSRAATVPGVIPYGRSAQQQEAPVKKQQGILSSPLLAAALVIVILILVAAILAGGGIPGGKKPTPAATVPVIIATATVSSPAPTSGEIAPPSPQPAETEPAAAVPEPVSTPVSVSGNGIWLYIDYPGNYTGDIKAEGWRDLINTTGVYLYQIPAQDTLIEGSIGKTDGSGDRLDVRIYNGGEPVFESSTTKPFGVIDIHEKVGAAIITNPQETPTPEPSSTIPPPDPSIVRNEVPANGTYVRVLYPTEFTGSIVTGGQILHVSGSGDQFFRVLPTGDRQVIATIEKPDGSGTNLVVEIYRDGSLLSATNTVKPYGSVVLSTTI